jgi:hypothetical protein
MRRLTGFVAIVLGVFVTTFAGAEAGVARYGITSTTENVSTEMLTLSSAEITPSSPPWTAIKETLHGGKQEGVETITLNNGVLNIVIVPTRGMSVFQVTKGEVRLGWDSPVKELVHPQYVHLESRGGLGWLEGFNEWMVRCGLEFAGHPGKDSFTTNTGDTAEMDLTLHGKVGNIPASEVEILVEKKAPYRITVRGVVHERLFFGPKLELMTEVSTVPGSETFRIHDTVTNRGSGDQELQLIYHGNFGAPILEKGAKFVTAAKQIMPMNGHAAKAIDTYGDYEGPTAGFIEEVFLMEPYADKKGNCAAVLKNRAGDMAASVRWNVKELPYLALWKNTVAEADGYVTGIEPALSYPFNRSVERKHGRVPKLAAGESREFTLDFGIHEGKGTVKKAEAMVEKIRDGRETTVIADPPAH